MTVSSCHLLSNTLASGPCTCIGSSSCHEACQLNSLYRLETIKCGLLKLLADLHMLPLVLDCSYGSMLCAGLRNLIMVLFAATTVRLMIENFLKYGIRINPKNWVMAVLTPEGDHAQSHAFLSRPLWLAVWPSGTYCSQALHYLSHKHYSTCHTSVTLAVTRAIYQL